MTRITGILVFQIVYTVATVKLLSSLIQVE